MLWVDYAYDVQRALDAMLELADQPGPDGRPLRDDDRFRGEVAAFYVDVQALLLMGYRGFSKFMRGRVRARALAAEAVRERDPPAAAARGQRVGRARSGSTPTCSGPAMWRQGSWTVQWMRSFGDDPRWHQRDPTQHHRRARPRPPTLVRRTMTDHQLTAGDVARMRTPLSKHAKTAIAQGDPGRPVALIDRAVEQWAALKDYSINWITSLLTFIDEELGEDAVEQALRKTGEEFVRPRRDTGTDWGSLPASARAEVIARAMLGNMGAVDVDEDDEKIILSFRCGSGGSFDRRRSLRRRPPVPDAPRAGPAHIHARRLAGLLRALFRQQRDPSRRVGRRPGQHRAPAPRPRRAVRPPRVQGRVEDPRRGVRADREDPAVYPLSRPSLWSAGRAQLDEHVTGGERRRGLPGPQEQRRERPLHQRRPRERRPGSELVAVVDGGVVPPSPVWTRRSPAGSGTGPGSRTTGAGARRRAPPRVAAPRAPSASCCERASMRRAASFSWWNASTAAATSSSVIGRPGWRASGIARSKVCPGYTRFSVQRSSIRSAGTPAGVSSARAAASSCRRAW